MAIRETRRSLKIDKRYLFCLREPAGCHTQEAIWPRDQEHRRGARSGVMSSAPVSTRRYQDSDSGSLYLRVERSSLLEPIPVGRSDTGRALIFQGFPKI